MARKKVAVVLSAGGACGLAHVGVLTMLERFKIPVDIVVGSSMGALVGGMYCAGKLKQFRKVLLTGEKKNIYSLFILKPSIYGIVHHEKVEKFLNRFLKGIKIENLSKRYACNALDLVSGEEIVFKKGDLVKAILASISIPGFFVPVKRGKRMIVDIGYFDPIPIKIAREMCPDCFVIAVDIQEEKEEIKPGIVPNMFQTFRRMVQIGQSIWLRDNGKGANVLIKLDPGIKSHQYHLSEKAIMSGEGATIEAISKIKRELGLP